MRKNAASGNALKIGQHVSTQKLTELMNKRIWKLKSRKVGSRGYADKI
jgi:hypothetical protein